MPVVKGWVCPKKQLEWMGEGNPCPEVRVLSVAGVIDGRTLPGQLQNESGGASLNNLDRIASIGGVWVYFSRRRRVSDSAIT